MVMHYFFKAKNSFSKTLMLTVYISNNPKYVATVFYQALAKNNVSTAINLFYMLKKLPVAANRWNKQNYLAGAAKT